MRPRRTEFTDQVYHLKGGTEDNDLWTYLVPTDFGGSAIASVWVPTETERLAIARGENIRLIVWMDQQPPVTVDLTDERILGVDRT